MTEQEWQQCDDPKRMLEFLLGKVSNRKLRLYTVACAHRVWQRLDDERTRNAVEIAEQFADDQVPSQALIRARSAVRSAERSGQGTWHPAGFVAWCATRHTIHTAACEATECVIWNPVEKNSCFVHLVEESLRLARLCRCVFGSPQRALSLEPGLLAWNEGIVTKIAQGIYADRAFDRLPVLADALEEAGCDDNNILNHCRQSGEHVRGCWVVDLILGKE